MPNRVPTEVEEETRSVNNRDSQRYHTLLYLHDAAMCQVCMVLGIHVSYTEGQPIHAQLQISNPQCAAHLALDVLLKVHTGIGRGEARQGTGAQPQRPVPFTYCACGCCCACKHACLSALLVLLHMPEHRCMFAQQDSQRVPWSAPVQVCPNMRGIDCDQTGKDIAAGDLHAWILQSQEAQANASLKGSQQMRVFV